VAARPVFQVSAARIRRGEEVLLVKQQGPDDPEPGWALPGGAIEPGELATEALAREVREETGLRVLDPGRLLYVLHHDAPDFGGQMVVFCFEVSEWEGDLAPDDPDALILDARFLPAPEAARLLEALPLSSMSDPVVAYLRGEAAPGALWLYRREAGRDVPVARVPGG
jgi:8-oxo-dGTP diphosphatase